jgi:hypothetical protein
MMNLNDEAIKAAVIKAVIDTLSGEKREEIISAAIRSLLDVEEVPKPGSHYDKIKRTKLEGFFQDATWSFAREFIREQITKDETIRARLRELTLRVVDKCLESNTEDIANAMAAAMAKALGG